MHFLQQLKKTSFGSTDFLPCTASSDLVSKAGSSVVVVVVVVVVVRILILLLTTTVDRFAGGVKVVKDVNSSLLITWPSSIALDFFSESFLRR